MPETVVNADVIAGYKQNESLLIQNFKKIKYFKWWQLPELKHIPLINTFFFNSFYDLFDKFQAFHLESWKHFKYFLMTKDNHFEHLLVCHIMPMVLCIWLYYGVYDLVCQMFFSVYFPKIWCPGKHFTFSLSASNSEWVRMKQSQGQHWGMSNSIMYISNKITSGS